MFKRPDTSIPFFSMHNITIDHVCQMNLLYVFIVFLSEEGQNHFFQKSDQNKFSGYLLLKVAKQFV